MKNPFARLIFTAVLVLLAATVLLPPAQAADDESDLIVVDALGEMNDAGSRLSGSKREAADSAKIKTQVSDFQKNGNVDIDRLLKTVNDTLSENRTLRKNMATVQESFERQAIENNVLKSRLRNLERRADEKDKEKAEILKDFNQRQRQIDKLRDENESKLERLVEQGKKLNDLKAEIGRLEDKLGEAILESERDEFKHKIETLKESTNQAIQELAKAKYLQAQYQDELGQSYYRMGNILFEQKNYNKAAENYEKALDYNPQLSYAHHNLGVIQDYYLNNNPEALKHYKIFLQMDPQDSSVDRIRERMVELELQKNLIPQNPLKLDYTEFHKKSN